MNRIEYQLLNILLSNDKNMTSNEISKMLAVSSRTIKRVIWDVNDLIKDNGASIYSDKSGYSLGILEPERFDIWWKEQERQKKELSISDDSVFKIIQLLLVNEYITQDQLSDYLYSSKSSINKYIKIVKPILEREQIILSNRPHYGYYLIGQETVIRNYMVRICFSDDDLSDLNSSLLLGDCKAYSNFLNDVTKMLAEYDYDRFDSKTKSLIKYFIVQVNRISNNHSIEKYSDEVKTSNISIELANNIKNILKNSFNIIISQDEVMYLSYLIGNPVKKNVVHENYDASFFEYVIDECFKEIKDVYKIDFNLDEHLRKGLIQHLYTSHSQIYLNMVLDNPIINLIKKQYVEAYNYAVLCGQVIQEKYNMEISENNLGYIATHFAAAMERIEASYKYKVIVVCESGYGTAELLKAKLQNKMTNIDIVDVTSIKYLSKKDLRGIFLIISSVPIPENVKLETPFIIVNPILLEKDIKKINEYLSDHRNINEYKKLFHKDLFFPLVKANNKTELINEVCDSLIKKGYFDDSDKKNILHRELISSTEINDLVAIPHCILESPHSSTFFCIVTLHDEIDWGSGEAQLIFIGGISRNGSINKKLFPLLYKLTMERDKVKKLCQIEEFDYFMDCLFSNIPVNYN